MPTIEVEAWLALKSRIDTLTTNPPILKVEPDAAFTPPSDAGGPLPFVLISDARNDNERISIGPEIHLRSGTLMLSLHWPVGRQASHAQILQIAGTIAGHFPADTRMQYGGVCLRVTSDPDVIQPYIDKVYRIVTVRIRWSTA